MENNKALLLFSLLIPSLVFAHNGETDKFGCHNDRKTADYHCHHSSANTPRPNSSTHSVKPQPATIQLSSAQVREANIAANTDLVFNSQSALATLGYFTNTPDGILEEQTIKAIKHFQVDNDLPIDGKPTYLFLRFCQRGWGMKECGLLVSLRTAMGVGRECAQSGSSVLKFGRLYISQHVELYIQNLFFL
jgi:hypothetical protein